MKLFNNVSQVCKSVLQEPENDFFPFYSPAMQRKKLVLRTFHYKFSLLNYIVKQLPFKNGGFCVGKYYIIDTPLGSRHSNTNRK